MAVDVFKRQLFCPPPPSGWRGVYALLRVNYRTATTRGVVWCGASADAGETYSGCCSPRSHAVIPGERGRRGERERARGRRAEWINQQMSLMISQKYNDAITQKFTAAHNPPPKLTGRIELWCCMNCCLTFTVNVCECVCFHHQLAVFVLVRIIKAHGRN